MRLGDSAVLTRMRVSCWGSGRHAEFLSVRREFLAGGILPLQPCGLGARSKELNVWLQMQTRENGITHFPVDLVAI